MEWTITTELNLAVKRHWKNLVKRMIGHHRNDLKTLVSDVSVVHAAMAIVAVVVAGKASEHLLKSRLLIGLLQAATDGLAILNASILRTLQTLMHHDQCGASGG